MEMKSQRMIQVKDLKPGMVVARPVRSFQGALLIREDTPLDDRKIKLLKTWGVDAVSIWSGDPDDGNKDKQRLKTEILERINLRFSKYQQDPLMEALRKVAIDLASLEDGDE